MSNWDVSLWSDEDFQSQQGEYLSDQLRIQCAGGFVEQHQLRAHRQTHRLVPALVTQCDRTLLDADAAEARLAQADVPYEVWPQLVLDSRRLFGSRLDPETASS